MGRCKRRPGGHPFFIPLLVNVFLSLEWVVPVQFCDTLWCSDSKAILNRMVQCFPNLKKLIITPNIIYLISIHSQMYLISGITVASKGGFKWWDNHLKLHGILQNGFCIQDIFLEDSEPTIDLEELQLKHLQAQRSLKSHKVAHMLMSDQVSLRHRFQLPFGKCGDCVCSHGQEKLQRVTQECAQLSSDITRIKEMLEKIEEDILHAEEVG